MRKIILILLMCATIFALSAAPAFAEELPLGVNALEYAEETHAEDNGDPSDSALISEAELQTAQETIAETPAPIAENPDTGVEVAIIPAAIALIVLIIITVAKKK